MTGKNIVNMIKTRRGEHPLFRAFGLGAVVDDPNRITRAELQVECAKWYPTAKVKALRTDSATGAGDFGYTVTVDGV